MHFENTLAFAASLDSNDPLKDFRNRFIIPQSAGKDKIYFLGNSLGLQPKSTSEYIRQIMDDWGRYGVESFFEAPEPWMDYHGSLTGTLSEVMGCLPQELTVMNNLTVNLHLMLVSFYRPQGKRYKILCEAKAFPSDQYMLETHVKHHGFDPQDAIVEVKPREGEQTLRTEDILQQIIAHRDELALVLLGGIHYYSGQVLDMHTITRMAQQAGAKVGFDLAHAAGNIEMRLHDWNLDFACWCSYKYLNSGPGAVAGAYIHERYHADLQMQRFAGWWGYDKATRFKMEQGFKPMLSAEGWQLGTPPLILYACHRAALDEIKAAGWDRIQSKRKLLTKYLWFVLDEVNKIQTKPVLSCITPRNETEQGSQVSMNMLSSGKEVYRQLTEAGFYVDWREPSVIRLAPVPLYNTFAEVWQFGQTLKSILQASTNW